MLGTRTLVYRVVSCTLESEAAAVAALCRKDSAVVNMFLVTMVVTSIRDVLEVLWCVALISGVHRMRKAQQGAA